MTHQHPEAQQYAEAAPELEQLASAVVEPVKGVDTAVTHFCMPNVPFRCWRFDPAARAFPKWVSEYLLVQSDGSVDFQYPENGHDYKLKGGEWVVLFEKDIDAVALYNAEEFAANFVTVQP